MNLMDKRIYKRGFTLLEVIIYSVLIAVILGYSIGSAYTLLTASQKLNERTVIDEEANFILGKVEWALNSLDTINQPSSGTSANSLSINRFNFAANPLIFDLSGTDLRLKAGAANPMILNNDRVKVTNLLFEHLAATTSKPAGVKTSLNINGRTFSITVYKHK